MITSEEFKRQIANGSIVVNKKGGYSKGDLLPEYKAMLSQESMKGKHKVRASKSRKEAVAAGFRSAFEQHIAEKLNALKIPFEYETKTIHYDVKVKGNCRCTACGASEIIETHPYMPDFIIGKYYIESKGWFTPADRKKMIAVKKCNPDANIIMLFQDCAKKISKGSKMTYAKWAYKYGFQMITINELYTLR